jgi:hypothetical protein
MDWLMFPKGPQFTVPGWFFTVRPNTYQGTKCAETLMGLFFGAG